jgi:hypothetical protein
VEPQDKAGVESVAALALAQTILIASLGTGLETLVVRLSGRIVLHIRLQILLILLGALLLHLGLVLHPLPKVLHELLTGLTSATR